MDLLQTCARLGARKSAEILTESNFGTSGEKILGGRYVAFVNDCSQMESWWMIDDGDVIRTDILNILNQKVYMLFYGKVDFLNGNLLQHDPC